MCVRIAGHLLLFLVNKYHCYPEEFLPILPTASVGGHYIGLSPFDLPTMTLTMLLDDLRDNACSCRIVMWRTGISLMQTPSQIDRSCWDPRPREGGFIHNAPFHFLQLPRLPALIMLKIVQNIK